MRLPIRRPAAGGRRTARVQRRSSFISLTRLLAAVGLAAVSGAFYWASVGREFVVDPAAVTIEGATYTDVAQVRADLGLGADDGSAASSTVRNIFRVRTDAIQQRIQALPAVLSASVTASLPNRLAVVIHERVPIFAWSAGDASWLVDRTGVLLAQVSLPSDTAAAALPRIVDLRTGAPPAELGGQLAPLDLEAARLLGAVTPADLGSAATELDVSVEDTDGWIISVPHGWRAVFGQFSPDLHKTDEIPRQVQCLASLLASREGSIGTVTLSVAPDRCGTFTDASPAPSAKPSR